MDGQYVIVSSITYAYKGRDALERKGIRVKIQKAPKNLSSCGCHYVLIIMNAPLWKAVEILESAHVKLISTGGGDNDLS